MVAVDDSDGDVRYRLLETIRQYAQSKLGAAGLVEETQRRHLDHFLTRPVMDWRQKWTWDFSWPDVHRDADNYRVALERAFAVEDAEAVLRLTGGLWNYWVWVDHPGARDWLTRALSLPDRPAHPGSVETLLAAGLYFGDVDLNRQAVQLAESLDDRPLLAQVYFFAGTLNDLLGVSGGPDYLVEAVRISEATGNTFIAGWCHYSFAWRAMFAGEPQRGREHAELAVAAAPAQGPGPFYGAHALGCLALASALCGDAERAESLADELLAAAREIPFASIQAMCLVRAAAAATLSGRWAKAESLLRELLVFLRRLGTDRWVGDALEFAAIVLEATDRPLAAGQVLRALDRHRADVTESTGRIQAVAEALNECRARIAARFGSDYHSENADRVSLATVEDRILVALRALDAPVG